MANPYNVTPQMIRDTAGWEHLDEELRSMLRVAADALEAREAELKGRGPRWRCFHCDEVFTTEHAARLHFGETECQDPACQIKAGAEMSMLEALRRAEEEARAAVFAMHEEGTDGWTAFRRLEGRTKQNAEAAENLGYERGLRDGRREAENFLDIVNTALGRYSWYDDADERRKPEEMANFLSAKISERISASLVAASTASDVALPPAVTGQAEIETDVTAAELGVNAEPAPPETCERCQGNGEIVTDWDRYRHPHPGDKGDEAVAECPDCGGEGVIDYATPSDASGSGP